MKSIWNKLHKIGDVLHLPELPNWLCGLLGLVIILRIPSFFEPYYYGDETIYLTVGEAMKQGVTLYSQVHENKPPLLYLLAAIAGNIFWFKVILAAWNFVTIIIFYKLSKNIFEGKEKAQKIATTIFAMLTTLPLLEGNIVNSELFMIGASILAILLLISENLNFKKIFLAGVLFGIAILFKVPAVFDVPVFIFYLLITHPNKWLKTFKTGAILVAGVLIPVALSMIWAMAQGNLNEYFNLAFLQNVGYLSTFRPEQVKEPFFVKNFPLLVRAGVVLAGLVLLFFARNKLSKKFILATVWLLFAVFAAALSERPYPHYLVQVIPPLTILITMFFSEKSMEQVYVIFPLTLALLVPVYYKFWVYPTAGYYMRFVNFATSGNKEKYFSGFSNTTNRNYKIAEFLKTSGTKTDKVFMWDPDSSTVYALSKRLPPIKYVADYHINDFSDKSEIAAELTQKEPKFIIITEGHPFRELNALLKDRYILITRIENADIYSRIESRTQF